MIAQISTISPDFPFLPTFAKGVWEEKNGHTFALSDCTIYLSTRRACRDLRDAFLRVANGRATVLPRLQPLGDVDEDDMAFEAEASLDDLPPAIPTLRRILLIARLVRQKDPSLSFDRAASLAEALARLIDEVQTNGRDFADLARIVPDDYAKHWQETLNFLEIVTRLWPDVLREEGCMDPVARRNAVLDARGQVLKSNPPAHDIFVAGSTASIPAVSRFMGIIAQLPRGHIVLPGLDLKLDETAWQSITESHPQFNMKLWLDTHNIKRDAVKTWPICDAMIKADRVRLIQESMRPASVSEAWLSLTPEAISPTCTDGLHYQEYETQQLQAEAIALHLRGVLEVPEKTAVLVTTDRDLAVRVSTALRRWRVEADDSAGEALTARPIGSFLIHLLAACSPDLSPVEMLALLKHPLTGTGLARAECRKRARQTEKSVLRGVRLSHGWRGVAKAEIRRGHDAEMRAGWLSHIACLFDPIASTWRKPIEVEKRINDFLVLAEAVAATDDEDGASILWRGEDGRQAARFLADFQLATRDVPPLDGVDFANLLTHFMSRVAVRPSHGKHARLAILGPLEARFTQADEIVIGGLNDDLWPPSPTADPWMSRPMKRLFGLPLPERRIGLSSHDFVQLACSKNVLMTRARRIDGSPRVPSRFLLQIDVVLRALKFKNETLDPLALPQDLSSWVHHLDAPDPLSIMPCPRPAPCPPLSVRPKEFHVTDIGLWQRNPYGFYAKRILRLRKLHPLDAGVSPSDFGQIIHSAFENIIKVWDETPAGEIKAKLLEFGRIALAAYEDRPQIVAFWHPRFVKLADWFIAQETERRSKGIKPLGVEVKGHIEFPNDTVLHGRADRVDILPDGTLEIIDYKTGTLPKKTDIAIGMEPQLPLLALIAQEGGFDNISRTSVSSLSYWHVRGRDDDTAIALKDTPSHLVRSLDGLAHLFEIYAQPSSRYVAIPRLRYASIYDDYAHLSRVQEWKRA